MKRGVMRGVARTRAMRFEWERLVTPLTPKSVVAEWQGKDAEIQAKLQEAHGTALTVEPVDWAFWKTQISAPGVVEQMQKDYEALNFPTINPYTTEHQEKLDQIQTDTAFSKKEAVHAANEVKEAEKVISTVNKVKAEGLHWSLEQWQAFMPGLQEQHIAEFEDEDYIVSDETMKLDSVDWRAVSKDFGAGQDPDLGAPDKALGDMVLDEELGLVKEGKWSIARVFAGKEERARIQERVNKALS